MGSKSRSTPSTSTAKTPPTLGGPVESSPESDSGGVMGWLRSAGDSIKQGASGVADSAKKWAKVGGDAADLDYDVGWGKLGVSGTLDQVLKVGVSSGKVPPEMLDMLRGAKSSNKVSLGYDSTSGTATLRADDLHLTNVKASGLTIGSARMKGVTVVLKSNKLEVFGSEQKGSSAELRAESVEAESVSYVGADGPVQADKLSLGGFSMRASTKGDNPLGGSQVDASFDVADAKVQGFRGNQLGLKSGSATGLSGRLDQGGESIGVGAKKVQLDGAKAKGASLGNGSVEGLDMTIGNKGGGMPLLDAKPDALETRTRVKAASVTDFHHPDATIGQGALSEAMVTTGANGATGTVGKASAKKIDTTWADADSVDAGGIRFGSDGKTTKAGVGSITAAKLATPQGGAGKITAKGIDATIGGGSTTASVASLEASKLKSSVAKASSVRADGLGYSSDGKKSSAKVAGVTVGGVTSDVGAAKQLSASGIQANWGGGKTTATAASAGATGLTSANGGAASVDLKKLSYGSDGVTSTAGVGGVKATGLTSGYGSAAGVTANQVGASWGNGNTAATVGSLGVSGLDTEWSKADSVTADKLRYGNNGGSSTAGADLVRATGVHGGKVDADEVSAHGVTSTFGGGESATDVSKVSAKGLDAFGGSLDQGTLGGIHVSTGDATRATIGSLDASGASYQDLASAGTLSARNAGITVRDDGLDANVGSVGLTGLAAKNLTAQQFGATGIGVKQRGEGTEASIDGASVGGVKIADRFGVGSATVRGAKVGIDGDTRNIDLASANAEQVTDTVTGSGVDQVNLRDAALSTTPTGQLAKVGAIGASGIKVDAGIPSLDDAAPTSAEEQKSASLGNLVRNLTKRVDHADVNADLAVNPLQSTFADIDPGTRAKANLAVRNNALTNVQVDTNKPVDLPGWIEGKGVYTDKGQLRANLGGWYDHKIGGLVNGALGVPGKQLPTMTQVGEGVAPMLDAPPAAGSAGAGTGYSPIDLGNSSISGTVGLSSGEIDQHNMRIGLQTEQPTDNEFAFESKGGQDLALAFSRFLAGSLSLDMGESQIGTGRTAVTDGKVGVSMTPQEKRVNGTIGSVSVEDATYYTPTAPAPAPVSPTKRF